MIKWAFSSEASLWVNALALVTSLICVVFFLFVLAVIWVSGNYAAAVATVAGTIIIAWGIAYREYKRSQDRLDGERMETYATRLYMEIPPRAERPERNGTGTRT